MYRTSAVLALALSLSAGAYAATTNTTLTVNASATIGASGIVATGTATLSNIGNGTFSSTIPTSSLTSSTVTAPFTITLSGGTLTGTLSFPSSLLLPTASGSGSGTGSATVTGGTGSYQGATGSFPSLTGSGGISPTGTINLTFNGGGSITTGGTTGGGGGGTTTPTPTITAVLDAAGNTANLAQGTIFIVKGSSLCPTGQNFFNVPRPTVAPDGVKITFTPATGGTGTDALLWYEYNPSGTCQLAGILQSTVAPGNYNVTVTNGTASAPFAVKVMKSKFSLFTQDSSGSGLASVQNYISASQVDLNSFTSGNGKGTTISPAHPGQFMLAYGTGMGPLVNGDNAASPAYDFSTNGVNVKAIVGGMTIPVAYAGRAGYAGEDQINFGLPANVPTGCAVPFQISVDGVLSNPTFIAIAPDATSTACVIPGFTASQLSNFDQGGSYTIGGFSLSQIAETVQGTNVKIDLVGGSFTKYTGYQLASATSASYSVISSGGCQVFQSSSTNAQTPTTPGGTILDAGKITISGPAGSGLTNVALNQDANSGYSLSLGTEGLGISLPGAVNATIVAGTYTLNGGGGKDVGSFTASVSLGAPLTVTGGLPSSVNRGNGLPINWTGGNSSDIVEIVGSSSTTTSAGTTTTQFICTTTAGQQTLTVPSSILQQLPATTQGSLGVFSLVNPTSGNGLFTAPLTAGGKIDVGAFLALIGTGAQVSYQ